MCACGCKGRPRFARGRFSKFSVGHNTFMQRQKRYIEDHGVPSCSTCVSPVKFLRGTPNKYCSHRCSGLHNGFSKPETQRKIVHALQAKYGVANSFNIPGVRERLRLNPWKPRPPVGDATRTKMSQASRARWTDPEFRNKVIPKLQAGCNTAKEKKRRAKAMASMKIAYRLSKVHRRWRDLLELPKFGFVSEQPIEGRIADELNPALKIVVEVNGDYIHANPNTYIFSDLITYRGGKYTAAEKWASDARKVSELEALGYKVIVVWESDVPETKRKELLEAILQASIHT